MGEEKILYVESSQIPLKPVPYGTLRENTINPITGKPYKGIVLEGVFADLKPTENNNRRIYDIPLYLEWVKKLHSQIHSSKGVYGELEHPKNYGVDYNNVSHKLLDIWWNPEEQQVLGKVMLLNTPKGKIAQEIVESGGQLAISARAAGDEISQSDGSKKAVVKLLVTYDLVYHPGFSTAVLDFKQLNEAEQWLQNSGNNKVGFNGIIRYNDLKKISKSYDAYISGSSTLNESFGFDSNIKTNRDCCFLEWFFQNNLNESQQEYSKKEDTKKEQEKLENSQVPNEDEKQKSLEIASEKELNEEAVWLQNDVNSGFERLKKRVKNPEGVYFDNSAGFVTTQNSAIFQSRNKNKYKNSRKTK